MRWITGLCIAIGLVACANASAIAQSHVASSKRVLLLYSLGAQFEPWGTWINAIRDELHRQSLWQLDVQEQSLVTARTGDEGPETKFVEYLTAIFSDQKPDLIIAVGAPAARFVQQHRATLFPATPMLLAAVEERRVQPTMLSDKDTVVPSRVDHVAAFKNILALLPKTRTVAMIIGNSPGEKLWIADVQRELQPLLDERNVELRLYNELPFAQLLREMARLPPDSAVFFQQLMVDGAGAVYGDKQPLLSIARVANAPIFTQDQSFFEGTVGGPMLSPNDGGGRIADVAVRIMGGKDPDGTKVAPNALVAPIYDWRQLQRWNISENRLPAGSKVLFREPSLWERYSWQITLIVLTVLLLVGLISILLGERHRRQLAEVEARQRMAELAHVNRLSTAGELGAMVAHEINQPLGAILANVEAAKIILKTPNPDSRVLTEIVDEIYSSEERAAEVIRRMRSLLKKVPFELRHFDLNDLARETVEFLSTLARGRKVELSSELTADPLPILGDQIQLQQVILNLVINSLDAMEGMPSERPAIIIHTARKGEWAELAVSDHGPGIPKEKLTTIFQPFFTTKTEGMGMGLSIARTIVESHEGQIRAENRDGGGASISLTLKIASSGTNPQAM